METTTPTADIPAYYFNRELSWLKFNRHVLDEAHDERHPLLERVKFLSISASNLDEFFMIRVSGLQRQREKGVLRVPPDGMTPGQQLDAIREALLPEIQAQSDCWYQELAPHLVEKGIHIHQYDELDDTQKSLLERIYLDEIFPVLTPLAFDSAHPFPFISNLSLNLAIIVRDPAGKELFARLKVPVNLFSRLIMIPPNERAGSRNDNCVRFVYLEDVISANLNYLFPGLEVVASFPFRITRDADIDIEVDEASDLLTTVEVVMERRARGRPVRIEVDRSIPGTLCHMLEKKLGVSPSMVYPVSRPLGMADLMELVSLERPDLKDIPFLPSQPAGLAEGEDIFSAIRSRDILLYHPYDSFSPVVNFLRQAARDPDVLAIKITLYRVGSNSPVVDALMEARENGKAVAALIELKARFDEENNIGWARALEQAGVHVVYGIWGLKVHAKLCIIVRREKDGIRRYVHLGTGNYNALTSRIYTDFGFFTCNREIGEDAAHLFNFLTGYARIEQYNKLLVAPVNLRQEIMSRIGREVQRHREHGDGYLAFKMNALVDPACISAFYRASQEGVRIDLQVRGICCIRPGIPGLSDTISVSTIVGRFLEHARIYYFRNGGMEEVFLGSADLMPRNLDRRVEILFPVENPVIKKAIVSTILPVQFRDNVRIRLLMRDGTYQRRIPAGHEIPLEAQSWLIENRGIWYD